MFSKLCSANQVNWGGRTSHCFLFSTRCRKLPSALKAWQAYEDLRRTIDDFNETCPLLEMMAHRAMMRRHWERIAALTGHPMDVEADNFLLRNLMEAPLLAHKEDIEVRDMAEEMSVFRSRGRKRSE